MPKRRYYGWRGSGVPDARDFHFAAPQSVLSNLPRKVNLDVPSPGAPFDPPYDQGALGSCGPNALSGMLVFEQLKKVSAGVMPSRLFIYYVTRTLMGTSSYDSGVDNRTMLKAVNKYGWCDETIWPYLIANYKTQPSQSCYTQAAERRITQYQAVPQTLDQMRGCLAAGHPFLFGFAVYESFESDAVDASGDVPMPATSKEDLLGGHDVVFTGYDDDAQMFHFRNSWGDWGHCLAGETEIALLDGTSERIDVLAMRDRPLWVYAYDQRRDRIVPARATAKQTGVRGDLVRVTLDNGESVLCTGDHLWMCRDGSFARADVLKAGDSLMPLYRSHKKGYEKVLQPNGCWTVTHWLVIRELGLRRQTDNGHQCENSKCKLVVHHRDFNGLNNQPDNLEVMFACEHQELHQLLGKSAGEALKRWWSDPANRARQLENSLQQIKEYNRRLQSGEVHLTEAQIAARRENVKKACEAAARRHAEEGPTEAQAESRKQTGRKLGAIPKTDEHRRKLSEALKEQYRAGRLPVTEAQRAARRENGRRLQARRHNHKVVSVEPVPIFLPVYDLCVEEHHNFAVTAGVFVHNSGYGRMPYAYATNPKLASDFWMITDPGWTPAPPPPPPPPPPGPSPPPNDLRIVLPQALPAGTYTLNPMTGVIVPH